MTSFTDFGAFPALVVRDGVAKVETADASILHTSEREGKKAVAVRVAYSCINYKDALAVTNTGKILTRSPLIPGIDYAGEALEDDGEIKAGDKVILTGYGVGEKYSGGYAAYARADSDWLIPLPQEMSEEQAMICGTAGLTAALCVNAIQESERIKSGGEVIVSGASGGVGSFAVALLARLGYQVTAVSRESAEGYLKSLGATAVITREEMAKPPRPLEKSRWHGAVDCVGGPVLARILAEAHYGGVVAACGLAASHDLPTSVMPFILRRVRLEGVESVRASRTLRKNAWQLLAQHIRTEDYQLIHCKTAGLEEAITLCREVLDGNLNGRVLVKPAAA